ncbi:MAG: hypothetical protein IJ300_11690, partial [Clostridia bacterium]|nr:hypothetical protein [Clostridia bacterium]
ILTSARVYVTPIPGEAMTEAGTCTFSVRGYKDGVLKCSVDGELIVMPSMRTSDVNEPADVTPTQAEQLQAEIEGILPDITAIMQEAKAAEENAETSAKNAATSEVSAETAAKEAKKYANDSETNLSGSLDAAKRAETAAENAENSANEAKETGEKAADELQKMIDIFKLTGNGSGAILISVHDELYKEIVPEDGQVYVVKYHDMPYGEDPNLISDEVYYQMKIGDGETYLAELPVVAEDLTPYAKTEYVDKTVDTAVSNLSDVLITGYQYVFAKDVFPEDTELDSKGNVPLSELAEMTLETPNINKSDPWKAASHNYINDMAVRGDHIWVDTNRADSTGKLTCFAIELGVEYGGHYIPNLAYKAQFNSPIIDVYLAKEGTISGGVSTSDFKFINGVGNDYRDGNLYDFIAGINKETEGIYILKKEFDMHSPTHTDAVETFNNREIILDENSRYYLLIRVVGKNADLTSTVWTPVCLKSFSLAPAYATKDDVEGMVKDAVSFMGEDSIKVGDTVLTEKELLAIKASAGTEDLSGFATKEELTAEIGDAIAELTAEDVGASPSGHTHTASGVGASPSGHTHDDRYYTEAEMDTKLAGKAASSHTHTAADVGAATEDFVTSAIEAAIGSAIGGSY